MNINWKNHDFVRKGMEFFIKYESIRMYWLISEMKWKWTFFKLSSLLFFYAIWYWNEYKSLFLWSLFSYEHHSFNEYKILEIRRMISSNKIKKSGHYLESFWNQNDKKKSDVHKLKIHDTWRSLQWVYLKFYIFFNSSGKMIIISIR